ncbi:nuclear transport factor 2 family protein [Sphingomonas sp. LR60]|uniref:nuclear transport factor 2 family protein n=1 Tax=Sphingomonas sp. LR60 TaxID=3050233 RepID=UPI002FE33831
MITQSRSRHSREGGNSDAQVFARGETSEVLDPRIRGDDGVWWIAVDQVQVQTIAICQEVLMRRIRIALAILAVPIAGTSPAAQPNEREPSEAALAKLDLQQKEMVAKADIDGLAALSSSKLTINAPTGRVLTREQFIAMMRSGQIGAENFERTVESVTVSGSVGVVMGNEVFTPTALSELGRRYGVVPLKRRYTNIYVRDRGTWRWLARHANVVLTR